MTAVAACGSTTSASSSGAGTSATSGDATISLVAQNTLQPGFAAVVKDFEAAYPQIKVNATYLPSDQFNTLISTQLASGGGPDLFPAFPGTGAIPAIGKLAADGQLANLAGQSWAASVPSDARAGLTVNGKLYGWPLGQTSYLLLYNKAEFTKLHLTVPVTFSDLEATCKAIKADGKIPIVQSGAVSPTNGIMAVELAGNTVYSGDPTWNAQRDASQATFAKTPGWTEALQEIANLQSAGCFQPDVQGVSVPAAASTFATGQALMWLGTAQNIGLAKATNPHISVGVAPVPSPTAASQVVMVAYPNNLVVNAHSSHTADAEKFVAYIASLPQARVWANAVGYTAPQDAAAGNLPSVIAPLVPFYKANKTRVNPIFTWPSGIPFQTLSTDVQGLFTGQKSPSAIVSDLDNAWSTS